MNIFQFYISIFGVPIHVLGIALVGFSILLGVYLQRRLPPHIRLMNTMLVVTLGHFVYEDMFIMIMGLTGRSMDAIFLYLIITVVLVIGLQVSHDYRPFLDAPIWLVGSILILQSLLFALMFKQGWFYKLQYWYQGTGSDPHNYLWAISKGFGFISWLSLLGDSSGTSRWGPY